MTDDFYLALASALAAEEVEEDEERRRRQIPVQYWGAAVEAEPADTIGDALRADAVAYWKFDEASGTRADATGRGNNLIANGTILSAAGKISNAVLVNTDDTWLRLANNGDISAPGATSFTFAFWLYFTDFLNMDIAFKPGFDAEWMYRLELLSDGGMRFQIAGTDLAYPSVISDFLIADAWYFVTAEFKVGTGLEIRINENAPQATGYTLNNIASGSADFTSCQRTFESGTASLDEMLFIKRALTSTERAYLYNAGAGRTLY